MGGQHQTRAAQSRTGVATTTCRTSCCRANIFSGVITGSTFGGMFPVVPRVMAASLGIRRGNANHRQETIQLGFGQRPRAFLFDGILRGQHMEGLGAMGSPQPT